MPNPSADHRFRSRPASPWWLLGLLLSVGSCSGDDQCGGPFCVVPPKQVEATRLQAVSGDGQSGPPGRELPLPVEVLVTDADDRPVADIEVQFISQQGGGSVSAGSIRSDYQGRATVRWTLGTEPGSHTLLATASGPTGFPLNGSPVTFSAQGVRPPPARLVLRQAPSDLAQNGIVFSRQPVIGVLDAEDQPVPGVSVAVAIADGPGTLNGTTTASTDGAGRAVFADLAILGAVGSRTLAFTATGQSLAPVTAPVEVRAGPFARIEALQPVAYQEIVGSPVSPAPSVLVTDDDGNPVPGVVVSFTADRDASVSPTTIPTDQRGIAQVTSWTLGRTADTRYTLSARLPNGNPVTFTADAKAGAAGRLEIVVQPSSTAQSGTTFERQPSVQILDQLGNPARQAGVGVNVTVSSGPSGTLQSTPATTDGSGRATFSNLKLTGLVGSYTVAFSSAGLAGVTSEPITLSAGPASRISVARQPSAAARSRVPFAAQPLLQFEDERGNSVPRPGVQVTASLASGDGTLQGTTVVTTDGSGQASYSDLMIVGRPGARTLRFTSSDPAAQVVTEPVVLPAVASIAVVGQPPASATVATVLQTPVTWSLTDQDGQAVADAPVTLSPSAGNTVDPNETSSDGSGLVRLQTWALSQTAGEHRVVLQAPDAASSTVTILATPGPAAQMMGVSGDGQSAAVGSALPEPLVVRVVDQFGNGVSGVTIEWRTCDGSGDFDASTDPDGFAGAVQETGADEGTFCVMASSAGLAGSPVLFSFTATPSQGSTSGEDSVGAAVRNPSQP
jgi:adhesin/invasin